MSGRILFVVDCYPPTIKSGGLMMADLVAECVSRGWTATVITIDEENASAGRGEEQGPSGERVLRVGGIKLRGLPRWRRAINEFTMSARIWWRVRGCLGFEDVRGIVFYSPSIFFGPLVAWLKRRSGARAFLVLRDLFPDWAVEAGLLRRGLVFRLFKTFERLQYRTADIIGVEATGNLAAVRTTAHPIGARGPQVLRNWIRLPPARSVRGPRPFGEDGVLFVYGGNIGAAQDPSRIFAFAATVERQPGAWFAIAGGGSDVTALIAALRDAGLTRTRYLGALEPERYQALLASADVGVLTLHRAMRSHNVPGKFVGYVASGLPVVALINEGNELHRLIDGAGIGFSTVEDRPEVLASFVSRLTEDAALRADMAAAAANLARREFSVVMAADQVLEGLSLRREVAG